ncbi:hypothetical protein FEAC_19100 [Ferrimicrobium acidiphilum DSM 19497]|uniref:Uncharacterized protein n=1 Tax=Ferrimicrobium acidiphilum DSM 19497 TaxID=1121877 RepID=A0A0D8FSP8_9ACTN|nr:hypothetical protein FEAC_19050 [Ferrimicrobium acidiphilum DSM 19497]KJE76300.1 hypothetical protein FEAC_19100 [Ferrimicrobium acidiphilum DSM 19497]
MESLLTHCETVKARYLDHPSPLLAKPDACQAHEGYLVLVTSTMGALRLAMTMGSWCQTTRLPRASTAQHANVLVMAMRSRYCAWDYEANNCFPETSSLPPWLNT